MIKFLENKYYICIKNATRLLLFLQKVEMLISAKV